jgi:hypothetical protein
MAAAIVWRIRARSTRPRARAAGAASREAAAARSTSSRGTARAPHGGRIDAELLGQLARER